MYPSKAGTESKSTQVVLSRLIDCHQCSLSAVYQTEFMHVHLGCGTDSLHSSYNAIVLVHYDAMAARPSVVLMSLEEANMVFTLVFAYMRVMSRGAAHCACTRPDKLSIIIVDVRSRICISVWSKEDVAWGEILRFQDVEIDNGSVKIWSLTMKSDGFHNVSYSRELTDRKIDVGDVVLSRPACTGPVRMKRAPHKLDKR